MNPQTINFQNNPKHSVKQTAKVLKNSGLIVFPTDTIYGLGANATDQKAVDKLLKFKGKREHKAISIVAKDKQMASKYADINHTAHNLYNKFLPGPFTIISNLPSPLTPHPSPLAIGVPSQENTIGIRIIPHPFLKHLFEYIRFPITATSANISGGANNSSIKDFLKRTPASKLKLIDLIIDAGTLRKSKPSTVIDTTKEDTPILRHGPIKISSRQSAASSQISVVSNQGSEFKSKHISKSETQTKSIAKKLIKQLLQPTHPQHLVLKDSKNKHRVLSAPKHLQIQPDLKPILIALQGQLGSGKTIFTQGIAQALGITEPIKSPTYTLLKEYEFDPSVILERNLNNKGEAIESRSSSYQLPATSYKLIHIDAWRLSSEEEFADLNLDQYLNPSSNQQPDLPSYKLQATSYPIIVLEWPQRLTSLIPKLQKKTHLILVDIKITGQSTRLITINYLGN